MIHRFDLLLTDLQHWLNDFICYPIHMPDGLAKYAAYTPIINICMI
ncbi:hypothetical protein ASZ90_018178 [hydrocarbon metagenome]|uniref:Uncharacterized protein n=1 Tax=hydrocarbon metagenome TaxID=938273 RepID=A0A0W8E6Y3_9ZZZZ